MSRRGFTRAALLRGALAALGAVMAAGAGSAATGPTVSIYAWADYFDPAMLDRFTRETGIAVAYDPYDNPEAAEQRLAAGSGTDVAVLPGQAMHRLAVRGRLARLDRARMANIRNVWPEIADRLKAFDPTGASAVPYMWGAFGIGFNARQVRQRVGERPVAGWDMAFRADGGRLKDCGVMLADSPEDIYPAAARMLGLQPDLRRPADVDRITDVLFKGRGMIAKYGTADAVNALAGGEACVVAASSADVLQARRRAREAESGPEIGFTIPREGAPLWVDSLVIPADAPNPDAARAFVDFMLKPDVAARNADYVGLASGVAAARAQQKPENANDPAIYPPPDALRRLFAAQPLDERTAKQVATGWRKVKTGK